MVDPELMKKKKKVQKYKIADSNFRKDREIWVKLNNKLDNVVED